MSHDLLRSLDEVCKNGENVGRVFVKFGPKLKSTYAVYCRSHDTASSLLEKVRGGERERGRRGREGGEEGERRGGREGGREEGEKEGGRGGKGCIHYISLLA